MTTPTFPSYMPSPMIAGFAQSPDFGMLVTQMDSGPDKQRPRNSVAIIQRTLQFLVESLANRNAFEVWVRDSVAGGSLWFNWPDPLSGTTKLARIVGGKVDYAPSDSVNSWAVKFTLETYG
ncbi:hypothetical protein [Pandoraea communis]|uniref:hypothetical protein n=1 Tax=Pandoraea communis TaxID=2508297 RepID=UPI0025A55EFD|nr:hypothetical protein [Pandoraea communis]MDM8356676.1 hypothetical protein [Pandoraea communis]